MAREFPGGSRKPILTSRRSRRRSASPPYGLLALLVILVLGLGGGWLWLRSRGAPTPLPTAGSDSMALTLDEPFVLPTLGASDGAVRRLGAVFSAHPQLAAWLATDDLVRRFVEAVVDISRGSSPVPALDMLIPEEPFSVQRSGNRLVMDPRSQRRYDLLGDVFASVDAQAGAEVYRRLHPLFTEAYREMGIPDGEFEGVLARAIRNLLAVDVPEGPFEVREGVGRYLYSDERIESLTPAEKHMYRLGPGNARRIQGKLKDIADELGLPMADRPTGGGEGG